MTVEVAIDMRPPQQAEVEAAGFDYSQIDEGIRDEVRDAATSIHQLGKAMRSSIIGIGKRLIEVKGMLPHGQFGAWIASEFDMSERTAERMMNVARRYEHKSDIVSFLSDTVLYMLASPSYPQQARVEVEQAAAEGKKITVEFAKEAVQKHKPEPVHYAPIYELERRLDEWLSEQERDAAGPPDLILTMLKNQTMTRLEPNSLLERLAKWLAERGIDFRKSDVTQAINNVREQRRQAKRQAEARMVYIEPESEPTNADTEPILPADLLEAGFRLGKVSPTMWALERDEQPEPYQSNWFYDPADAIADARKRIDLAPTQGDALVQLIISPTVDISSDLPNSLRWAIRQATDEQLLEADRRLPDALREGRGPVLRAALRRRGIVIPEPQPEPSRGSDPRLALAREGIALIRAASEWVQAHYYDLTGRDMSTDLYQRDCEKMILRLQSLVEAIEEAHAEETDDPSND